MLPANSITVCQLTNSAASPLMKLHFPSSQHQGWWIWFPMKWLRPWQISSDAFFFFLGQDEATDVDLVQTRAEMHRHTSWIKHEACLIRLISSADTLNFLKSGRSGETY